MSGPRTVVIGVGNELRGDDGFGVAVARRLRARALPAGVVVRELGTRAFDLALALLEADVAIVVDAVERGGAPGTLRLLDGEAGPGPGAPFDAHALHPAGALDLVRRLGGTPPALTVVGCEPGTLASEEEPSMTLSPAVEAAIEPAIQLVLRLVEGAPHA